MKIPEFKKLIKDENIRGTTHCNKREIMKTFIEHKVLPEDYVHKQPKVTEATDEKYYIDLSISESNQDAQKY